MISHPITSEYEGPATGSLACADYLEQAFFASRTPQLVLDAASLCVKDANTAAADLLGLTRSRLMGEALIPFFTEEGAAAQFAGQMSAIGAAGRNAGGSPLESNVRRAGGAILPVEISATACRLADGEPGFLLTLRDLTLRKLAAEECSGDGSQAATYQYLIDCLGDGLLALDPSGFVVFANASAARILGQSRRQLLGSRLIEIFPHLEPQDLARAANRSGNDTHAHAQPIRIPVFLGCELHQFEFVLESHRQGISVLFRDVSVRVKQEMEIAQLNATMAVSQQLLRSKNEELNDSMEKMALLNEQLADADKLKSEFLANTSHELRTPLNSIIGFLQLICEGLCESRDEEQQYVRNAMSASQQLLSIINDVLDIAKIEAGKMNLLIDDIDVNSIFHEVFSMTQVQVQGKGLEFAFEVRDESHRMVRADFHKVKQVLVNLVGNSAKFTSAGFIRVWAEPDPVRPGLMRISVQDSGIGVPLHLQKTIFEKFTQGNGASTRKYQGTGLGLAISKNLVDMMGGALSIYSAGESKGTTVSFTLPMGNCQQRQNDMAAGIDVEEVLPTTF